MVSRIDRKAIICVLTIICFHIVGCSGISKEDKNLIRKINSKYYSVKSQGVKSIRFEYISDKFLAALDQIKNQSVKEEMKKVKFYTTWKPNNKIITNVNNRPKFRSLKAETALIQMFGGVKTQSRAIFIMLSSVMDNILYEKNIRRITVVSDSDYEFIEIKDKSNAIARQKYKKPDYLLVEDEFIRDKNIIAVMKYKFDIYNGQYLLRFVRTSFKDGRVNDLEIDYDKKDGVLLLKTIKINSSTNPKISDTITLIPLEIVK